MLPELLSDLFFNYTLRTIALGVALLGLVSGVVGSFAVLRRQALLGDVVSHAALPGIVLAFMLAGTRATPLLLLGAAVAGWLAAWLLLHITRTTPIKEDAALGLILSVFFGAGLVLMTITQRTGQAGQAGLDSYLFGQAAALVGTDVLTIAVVGGGVLAVVLLLWKEFKLLTFDAGYATSLGLPTRWLNLALTALIVVAIVTGLQTVGVILMSALLVAPAAAARQWTNRLGVMTLLAGAFGAVSSVVGALISYSVSGMSTGPTIVLCVSLLVVFSLLFAPARGVVWQWWRRRRQRSRVGAERDPEVQPEGSS